MDKTELKFGTDFLASLKKGIDTVYDAVSPTLGGAGKNVLYRSAYSRAPMVTNDGVSIARMIHLKDETEAMGADLIKQAASRTNDEAGDGTTTVVVLSKHMIDKGFELIKDGANPMRLRKEISDAAQKVIGMIKDRAIPIKTDDDIFNIANISMENPEIAQIVVDAVKKVGENGTVIVEESNGLKIEKEEIDGLKFDKGYISPYMVTHPATMESILTETLVLVTDKTISTNSDIIPLIEDIHSRGIKQLLIICDNFQGEALSTIVSNRLGGIFNCVVVNKPNDTEVLHDIAIATGAEALTSEKVSGGFGALHFKCLGKAKKVIVTKDSTLIIGGYGDKEKIKDRIELLKTELKDKTGYVKEQMRERLAKLVGGIVILKVGAPTEAEMKYLKLKIDDAVASTRAAVEEGIVIGGGKTLYEIAQATPETAGEEIVYFACCQPIRKILDNAGFEVDSILSELKDGDAYDVSENRVIKDVVKHGLVDPAKVERCAVLNAASLAKTVITTHCGIIDVIDSKNS